MGEIDKTPYSTGVFSHFCLKVSANKRLFAKYVAMAGAKKACPATLRVYQRRAARARCKLRQCASPARENQHCGRK
jgi:hypothetical protein